MPVPLATVKKKYNNSGFRFCCELANNHCVLKKKQRVGAGGGGGVETATL